MLKLRISAENALAFKREADILFNFNSKLEGHFIFINKKISKQKILDLCARSAGIKKAYLEDYCIWERQQGQYSDRLPQVKPAFHPTALKPKLARLMVNLAGTNTQIVDCFCGTGSIVLESAILGIPSVGIDIDWKAVQSAKKNMRYYSPKYSLIEGKDWNILIGDATNLSKIFSKKLNAIVCDPPYGRSSTLAGRKIKELYSKFLEEAHLILKKNSKIIFIRPSTLKLDMSKYNVISEFEWYVHRSLTRVITEVKV